MAWNAYLTLDEYERLLEQYPKYQEIIKANSQVGADYVTIAYATSIRRKIYWISRDKSCT